MHSVHALLLLTPFATACSTPQESSVTPVAAETPRGLPEAELAERIERGRALLDAGRPAEAEAIFAETATLDGDSLRARMWLLRAWMDEGRSNDTLDALDELARTVEGEGGMPTELVYLYGMAFARRAEGHLAQGIGDSSIEMNFTDARQMLVQALRADPDRYHDAWLPLARAAWFGEDLETARWAADHAVESTPRSVEAWLQRGRVVMAQFAAAEGVEPGGEEAEALWSEAARSFQSALESAGSPTDEAGAGQLAEAATQLGHTMMWRQKGAEATDAYATAIAWNPRGFDYWRALDLLRGLPEDLENQSPRGFLDALRLARERLEARGPLVDEGAATLLWWLGWANFSEARWDDAESAFLQALAITPDFANSWFYVALARQYRKDSLGALEAIHAGWDRDPSAMVQTAASSGGALRGFENLLGWCASEEPPRNMEAAFVAEMLAQAMPEEPRHWNNVGLFLRDEGERLERDAEDEKAPEPDPALLADLYERSYEAYQRALALTPDDPQVMNDTALMLHYHLGGEYDEVERRYLDALARCDELLAATDLSEADRARFEQTRKDIDFNLRYLRDPEGVEKELEAQKAKEAAEKAAKEKAATDKAPVEDGTAASSSGGD